MRKWICLLIVIALAHSCSTTNGAGDDGIIVPRYKLYNTENIYNLIKLDTATGALWMVQYGMNENVEALVATIDDSSLLDEGDLVRAGRFELYPTRNIYTYILLDTEKGITYQVQWYTDPEKRFRIRID